MNVEKAMYILLLGGTAVLFIIGLITNNWKTAVLGVFGWSSVLGMLSK